MWERADRCRFFQDYNWLSVCLFSDSKSLSRLNLRQHVVWTKEAYFYLSLCLKRLWYLECLQPGFFICERWCDIYCMDGVYIKEMTEKHPACDGGFSVDLPVKTLISFTSVLTHDSRAQTYHMKAEIVKIWGQDNNFSNHCAHSCGNIIFLLM